MKQNKTKIENSILNYKHAIFSKIINFYKKQKKNFDIPIYIITRFNIQAGFSKASKKDFIKNDSNIIFNTEYLTERFRLFEKYYLPSLESQTDQNFKFIVLFHPDTPEQFKNKIEELQEKYTNFVPQFIKNHTFKTASDFIKNDTQEKYITTIRLDNDDSISVDFIKTIRENIVPINGYFINFSKGLLYDEGKNIFYNYSHPSNHYLIYTEKRKKENLKTVYCLNHSHAKNELKYLNITTSAPMYIEVIHGSNCTNILGKRAKEKNIMDSNNINNFVIK